MKKDKNTNPYDAGDSKKKQNLILGGAVVAIVVFLVIIFSVTGKKQPQTTPNPQSQAINVNGQITDNTSDQEIWIQKSKLDMDATKNQVNDLQSRFAALQQNESQSLTAITQQMKDGFTKINVQIEQIKSTPIATSAPAPLDSLVAPKNGKIGLPGTSSADGNIDSLENAPGIDSINVNGASESGTSSKNLSDVQDLKTFMPIGFVKARMITAVDAPAGGTAQDNPFPVLLNITGFAQLPNAKRLNLTGCMLLAAGYGDAASERAYFRGVEMGCVTKDNKVIEQKVEGYIVDEDGKAGMAGTLVSKEGSALVKSLLAGTIGGLGQAFANTATTLQQTPIGPTQVITPSQSLGYAGATGISSGFQQLSQYYINLAEKTFPVIEITNQRNVSFVFTKGMSLPVSLQVGYDSNNKRLPINVD